MFSKKELKVIRDNAPSKGYINSDEAQKAWKKGYRLAEKQSR